MDHYLTNTDNLTRDCIEGLVAVFPDRYQTLSDSYNGRVLLQKELHPERVNVIVSGGGGVYPFSAGYVNQGMADASVNGSIRAAPSAYDIYEAAKAIGSKEGYLLIYNNFMGDYLNNDLAAEMLALEGIQSRLCACTDDCLSAPSAAPRTERTGLIGIVYLLKIASACAQKGLSLDETHKIVSYANQRISSVTVTLDFNAKTLSLGAGFSGEPPVFTYNDRFTMKDAAQTAYDLLVKDLQPSKDCKLHLIVSRMEQTRCEEAFIFAKEINQYASAHHPISHMSVGYFAYLMDTPGFFVTLLCEDETLSPYIGETVNAESFIL